MHRNIYLVFPRKILVMINKFLSPVAIASFANFVPEIVELLGNRPKYAGTYEVRQLVNINIYSFLLCPRFTSYIFIPIPTFLEPGTYFYLTGFVSDLLTDSTSML